MGLNSLVVILCSLIIGLIVCFVLIPTLIISHILKKHRIKYSVLLGQITDTDEQVADVADYLKLVNNIRDNKNEDIL